MSLFADILTYEYASDDDLRFDEATKTWTVIAWELDGDHLPGIPDKSMALAIVRAIRAGYRKGAEAAAYNS